MMRQRTVALIGALGLAAGWLAGNAASPPAQEPPAEQRSGPRPLGSPATTDAPYTEQLRQRLDQQPRTPVRGRNPFVFGSRQAVSAARIERELGRTPEPAALQPAAATPVPMFRLSGVASTEKDGAVVLTAILLDHGSMIFAKAGDTLARGYRVVRVDETAVVIADAAGAEQVLRLP